MIKETHKKIWAPTTNFVCSYVASPFNPSERERPPTSTFNDVIHLLIYIPRQKFQTFYMYEKGDRKSGNFGVLGVGSLYLDYSLHRASNLHANPKPHKFWVPISFSLAHPTQKNSLNSTVPLFSKSDKNGDTEGGLIAKSRSAKIPKFREMPPATTSRAAKCNS